MKDALASAAARNCQIRILTMSAQNPAFVGMLNPKVTTADPATQRPLLEETRSWFRSTLAGAAKADVRALQRGSLFQQIIIADNRALVSPYLYSADTGYSPCLEISENCPVFPAFIREFDELWNANAAN